MSVAEVVSRSGVSRRTFYEHFLDRDDCFLAAFENALAVVSQRVLAVYEPEHKWRERIRMGVVAFLSFLDEEPVMGCILVRESLAYGSKTRARREEVLARLARTVDEGRGESASAATLPPLTAEGLVGGVLSILEARLSLSNEKMPMVGLVNGLVSMIMLPYLGPSAARRELDRPLEPPVSLPVASLLGAPFKDAGMRLTYRTVRVLVAIGEWDGRGVGLSNRVISDSAGIADQGQMSKLLNRLRRIGLIENAGLAPGQGAPNAWVLTSKGRELTNSLRVHTTNDGSEENERQ